MGRAKTPGWTRVNALERDKVITGYRAEIDPSRLGLQLHTFVQVTINTAKYAELEAAVNASPAP